MKIYSRDDERNIRMQRLVHDWNKSGLVTDAQRDRMLPELEVNFRRTNKFLRGTLLIVSSLIIGAAVGLVMTIINPGTGMTTWLSLLFAAICFIAAQWLVTEYRLYRFGVEEAAAILAAVFVVWFGTLLSGSLFKTDYAFALVTAACYALYARFGFLYAGVGAILFATCFVFDIEQSDTFRRLFSMILMLSIFFFSRERRQDHDPDFPADDYAVFEAVAWAGLYLVTNLKISEWVSIPDGYQTVYWVTYGLIWLLPAAGLWFAIRDRHRWMLDLNIALAIVTLMTNKPYLGAAQKAWDPILFGVMLVTVSLGLRRWIANGPHRSRSGFVAHRLLESEKAALSVAASATVLAPGAPAPSPRAQEPPPSFGGGRSGGAGASGSF